ncbi:MAG: 16S rRNA (guanine527-N7)-methyltransferase [Planctomycetota bacterium]|jgi:16S rRNA (guanine527-N7)-methyltransferase
MKADDAEALEERLDGLEPDDQDEPGEGGQPDSGRPSEDEVTGLAEELDVEGEDDDEDEDEDEDEGAEEEEGQGAGENGPVISKAKAKADEEEVVKNPDTPVPSRQVMLSALEWAFADEEGISPEFLGACADHALATLEKNRVMNLTTILDPKEFAAKYYLDSWRVTRLVPLMARKVLDLGTGAGFPGIPLALAEPNLSMTVVDSTQKKITFVDERIEKLGLRNTRAVWSRAEDHLARERVDVVLVRAVSSVRENVRTLRKVRHSLQDLVMLKGSTWSREVRAAEREAERLGFKLDTVWEHELPGEMGGRAILVYRAPGGAGM